MVKGLESALLGGRGHAARQGRQGAAVSVSLLALKTMDGSIPDIDPWPGDEEAQLQGWRPAACAPGRDRR
jgi:hypothetical protein